LNGGTVRVHAGGWRLVLALALAALRLDVVVVVGWGMWTVIEVSDE
jgi:hypothetical protein